MYGFGSSMFRDWCSNTINVLRGSYALGLIDSKRQICQVGLQMQDPMGALEAHLTGDQTEIERPSTVTSTFLFLPLVFWLSLVCIRARLSLRPLSISACILATFPPSPAAAASSVCPAQVWLVVAV